MNLDTTAVVTNDDLNCKAIVDLIDTIKCDFFYEPSEQLGYVQFSSSDELEGFIEHICDIKETIIYFYDCYNS